MKCYLNPLLLVPLFLQVCASTFTFGLTSSIENIPVRNVAQSHCSILHLTKTTQIPEEETLCNNNISTIDNAQNILSTITLFNLSTFLVFLSLLYISKNSLYRFTHFSLFKAIFKNKMQTIFKLCKSIYLNLSLYKIHFNQYFKNQIIILSLFC